MKSVSEISGLQSIKSMHTTSKRAIPRTQTSAYLDLYMLGKEKDRIEKEIYILDKRKKNLQKKLDGVNKKMDKLQKTETRTKKKVSHELKKPLGKDLKMMSLGY